MSTAYKRRYRAIARRQWSFDAQAKREAGRFMRHLTSAEREKEFAGDLPDSKLERR
jgi:hypothetical protein